MDNGQLRFRYEGKYRRCKLEDVLKLKAAEEKQTTTLPHRVNAQGLSWSNALHDIAGPESTCD
jgi:hypothetical protein